MGYSISIKFQNKEQKQQCIEFITENKTIINEIVSLHFLGTFKMDYFDIVNFSEDQNIPYGPKGKNLIGWKEIGIPKGLYAFVIWLSFKCNQNHYYYDNEKFTFISTNTYNNEIENLNQTQVNSQGILYKEHFLSNLNLSQRLMQYINKEQQLYEKLNNNFLILEEVWTQKISSQLNKNSKINKIIN